MSGVTVDGAPGVMAIVTSLPIRVGQCVVAESRMELDRRSDKFAPRNSPFQPDRHIETAKLTVYSLTASELSLVTAAAHCGRTRV